MALKNLGKLTLKLQVTDSLGKTIDFLQEGPEILVGRGSACQVRIKDVGISRQHLKIEIKGQQIFLTDLQSSNGTFINDEKLEPDTPTLYETFFMPIRLGPKLLMLLTPETII